MLTEIFGPVVAVTPFREPEQALANVTGYGLAASVRTESLSQGRRLAGAIRAGTVWMNCYSFWPGMPKGGHKQSRGGYENGRSAPENYLESETVCAVIQTTARPSTQTPAILARVAP